MFEEIFCKNRFNVDKLIKYGFKYVGDNLIYSTPVLGDEFQLKIIIDADKTVDTFLFENETKEEYVLYKTQAEGAFVGQIRSEIVKVLEDIKTACCDNVIFKAKQADLIFDYVKRNYGDSPEFLWTKFPDNAIFRRKDNRKWYMIITSIKGMQIGMEAENKYDIIDLKMDPEKSEEVLSHKGYYPGWHMNKKSWYTLILDKSVSDEELMKCIDYSYILAADKRGKNDYEGIDTKRH